MIYDAIIIGGGPAGLSAALLLGRCCRRVLVCDAGKPRNAASQAMHGYLTRDGTNPNEFLKIGRDQLSQYRNVEILQAEVFDVKVLESGFEVILADKRSFESKKLLIATGVADQIPPIAGIDTLYGKSVFHCPYCDGWEFRGQPIAIYGKGDQGKGLALELLAWSKNLLLCTDGPSELSDSDLKFLKEKEIKVKEARIKSLNGSYGVMTSVTFEDDETIPRRALFFSSGQDQASNILANLGCDFNLKGTVETKKQEKTNIPGLYVAGDASHNTQLVCVAVAEGAEAAIAINKELLKESL